MHCLSNLTIEVGARASPLSRIQVQEVWDELKIHHPSIQFNPYFSETVGDRNQQISLRSLGKTDFFTKEIDDWVLAGAERIGIHSAKDLADPLSPGLTIFCLTQGVNSTDALVLRNHLSLDQLVAGAKIATSSERREKMVQQLRQDLTFYDIRGTIGERLKKLETGEVDGVVIAEAALIRLKLTHLNRIILPGVTVEGQGQLAVVGRLEDKQLQELFSSLDVRDLKHSHSLNA
jgi:hydroxymethylbilane synthase